MQTFTSLYHRLVKAGLNDKLAEEIEAASKEIDYDPHHLDCLLNPRKYPAVVPFKTIVLTEEEAQMCDAACEFDAIERDAAGNYIITDQCVGCGACIDECVCLEMTEVKEFIPIIKALNSKTSPVYAMIAPAYISQFSDDTTPGKLRSAFKALGFAGMIEVALFADILTLKEALEFDRTIISQDDFMLTSCCCPMWIAMIKKVYHELVPNMPAAVSPMVACGRAIKALQPDAITVFVGPCIAKKAEARNADIADAVDYVLTFEEMRDIFYAATINPEICEEDLRDHSSLAGRTYAITAGVSEAVQATLNRLRPDREIKLKAEYADGVPACKEMLNKLTTGNIKANFIEGMGCVGGCVGGPKALIDKEKATAHVDAYGNDAEYKTPVDNPYVIELLNRLGFETIDQLLEEDHMFVRDFEK